MRRFELALPESVDECLHMLAERGPAAKMLAGGTDLLPQLKNSLLKPAWVVDLSGVTALRQLESANGQGLRIGAAVTAREIERHAHVRAAYPALAESGALVGSVQIRNLATVGGNLCNAAPSADMAPPLLSLDIAVVGVASQVTLTDGVCRKARIALASVAPTPVRATAAEQALEGQPITPERIEHASTLAVEAARPISDQRGSADFRRHLVRVLTRRTLTTALARASA